MTLLGAIKDTQLVKGKVAKEVAEKKFGDKQGERENGKKEMRKSIKLYGKGENKEIL